MEEHISSITSSVLRLQKDEQFANSKLPKLREFDVDFHYNCVVESLPTSCIKNSPKDAAVAPNSETKDEPDDFAAGVLETTDADENKVVVVATATEEATA
ncbi:hypothetical protein SESBI_21430 [Sesbania bispinosa]|nr:hypothetical protein SESBI_21430 [Sesbania bispinosa]